MGEAEGKGKGRKKGEGTEKCLGCGDRRPRVSTVRAVGSIWVVFSRDASKRQHE